MAKTNFLFYTNCKDPEREQELSDWYDQIHIPDVEAVPGFLSCIRYRLTDLSLDDSPKVHDVKADYLSIVEADVDADTAISRLVKAIQEWTEKGRMLDLFEVVSSEIISEENPSYRKI